MDKYYFESQVWWWWTESRVCDQQENSFSRENQAKENVKKVILYYVGLGWWWRNIKTSIVAIHGFTR